LDELSALIQKAKKGGSNATEIINELANKGASAAPTIITSIKRNRSGNITPLKNALLLMDDPNLLSLIPDLLKDESGTIRLVAIQMLAQIREETAFNLLCEELDKQPRLGNNANWAADALGERGDDRAIPLLAEVLKKLTPYDTNEILSTATALAKLGDQSGASHIIKLVQSKEMDVSLEASAKLPYVVGTGLFATSIEKLNNSTVREISKNCLESLIYLGTREVVEELLKQLTRPLIQDYVLLRDTEDSSLPESALAGLYDITGAQDIFKSFDTVAKINEWWKKERPTYHPQIGYRFGKPRQINDIIQNLESQPKLRRSILKELRIITGQTFGLNPFIPLLYQNINTAVPNALAWLNKEGSKFEPGKLYKYGHLQDISIAFQNI